MFPCPTSRLDLVPINRSVGLKAKPTKPVTEVLRPVVAKYGLDLGSLLVRLVSVIWSLSTATRAVPHLALCFLYYLLYLVALLPKGKDSPSPAHLLWCPLFTCCSLYLLQVNQIEATNTLKQLHHFQV